MHFFFNKNIFLLTIACIHCVFWFLSKSVCVKVDLQTLVLIIFNSLNIIYHVIIIITNQWQLCDADNLLYRLYSCF